MEPGSGGFGGAFGGNKAGAANDPLTFIKKPAVILRLCALLFAIIVFGCISSQGWHYDNDQQKEECVMNKSASACHFSTFVGIIGFVASIGFCIGEWFFEQMSSIKTRKHYVIADMAFSGVWAFFYFVAFCLMTAQWNATEEQQYTYARPNIIGAIFFALLSVIAWSGCVYLAFVRYKAGSDTAFTEGLGEDEEGAAAAGAYQSYPSGPEDGGGGYSEPPFSAGSAQTGMGGYQQQY